MFHTTHRGFIDDYIHQLPSTRKISRAATDSALYSFVLSALVSGNVHVGLATAALAATVSVVSGLTRPILRNAFADHRGNFAWYHRVFISVINLGITQLFINSLTAYHVNLMTQVFFIIGVQLFLNQFSTPLTDTTLTYIMI